MLQQLLIIHEVPAGQSPFAPHCVNSEQGCVPSAHHPPVLLYSAKHAHLTLDEHDTNFPHTAAPHFFTTGITTGVVGCLGVDDTDAEDISVTFKIVAGTVAGLLFVSTNENDTFVVFPIEFSIF